MKTTRYLYMIIVALVLFYALSGCGSGTNTPGIESTILLDTSFTISNSNRVYYSDSIIGLCFSQMDITGLNRYMTSSRAGELLLSVEHYTPLDIDTEYYIMIGVADMWDGNNNYIENMEGVLNALEGERVNVYSILPTDNIWVDNADIQSVNNKLRILTLDHGFNYMDVYWDFVVDGVLDPSLSSDGLHLTTLDGCEKLLTEDGLK